ncbi:MAG: hypothetical protein CVU12_01870 [Bacteroidetes bacterium HGW-Bacteroidetes-7]|nr:MAG: hypothetical protein CVU12_01870 [Bacteroidetes bacterium HGW-Bacteroidetes-7]
MSGEAKKNTHCAAAGFFFVGPPHRIAERQGGNPEPKRISEKSPPCSHERGSKTKYPLRSSGLFL